MIAPSIFKYAQQKPPAPGVEALQKGITDLIWSCRKLVQDTEEDVTGLYGYFKKYLANLDGTYPKGVQVTGVLDQATIDNFVVLRDKFIQRLATRNLAVDIPQHKDQSWYKTAVYYGEQVMAIFQPTLQTMASVKEDPNSLEQHGAAIGHALTSAGDQLLQLTEKFKSNQRDANKKTPVEASVRAERRKKLSQFLPK